jgi:HEAT repeats
MYFARVTGHAAPPRGTASNALDEAPFPPALVEEMLRAFGRAVRAHQLYLHNNPTYLKSLDAARASFHPIWAHTAELTLEVSDTQLRWAGRVVLNEPDKTTDALPWVLYKDGLRELRFLKEVEAQELVGFIDVITRVRKALHDEDDLLTLMWEREFNFIRYRYVDMTVDGVEPLDPSDLSRMERLVDPSQVRESATEEVMPPGVVSIDDFNTTLYFLEEKEVEYLRTAIQREYASELRTNVVASLLDTYEQQVDPTVREEIAGVLDILLVNLLTTGQLGAVASLLHEVTVTADRARSIEDGQRARLLLLADRLSEPEALTQLLQAIDERVDAVGQQELNDLFDQLRVQALGTIFQWLGRVQNPRVRAQLETAAARLAAANTNELIRLIGSGDRDVSLEAVRRAGAMRAPAAVPALGRLLQSTEAEVRLVAVQALAEIGSPGSLQALERTLDDPSRDVRVGTARAFAARTHRPALNRLESLIKEQKINGADLTEKMAVFEAYGAMCGEAGIPMLDGILNGRGLFGKRGDPELRACAAMALGRIASEAARAVLMKAGNDKEVLVRNAVNRGLRPGPA